MKKVFCFLCVCNFSLFIHAQTTKPASKSAPVKKPAAASGAPVLKNAVDSCSYAIGMLDGNFFKMQGITDVNPQLLGRGFEDMLNSKPLMTPEQADQVVRRELQKMTRKKIQPHIDEGKAFLEKNGKRPGVKQTASGLQYEVITEGTGPKPVETSRVKVHYTGTLINGHKFDSSRDRGEPYETGVNEVIRGWIEALQLMSPGARYKLYIPYQLGYGEQGNGEIPGGATLLFDVELVEIVKQ